MSRFWSCFLLRSCFHAELFSHTSILYQTCCHVLVQFYFNLIFPLPFFFGLSIIHTWLAILIRCIPPFPAIKLLLIFFVDFHSLFYLFIFISLAYSLLLCSFVSIYSSYPYDRVRMYNTIYITFVVAVSFFYSFFAYLVRRIMFLSL